ncbi:MAG: MFS transporter [Sedimenticolaceae bacterium]|nr:MFS transporter [Sedimenticolaceae bacterium]
MQRLRERLAERPELFLFLLAAAMPLAFRSWQALLNNFAIERAGFTGVEIGILQSLREIPGFLAFTVVFVLLVVREQTLALVSLIVLGIGVAITGMFPGVLGLYVTTVIMSVGFHYLETINQSLSLQWLKKETAAHNLGRMIAIGSFTALLTYGMVYLMLEWFGFSMESVYLAGGGAAAFIGVLAWLLFPRYRQPVEQRKHLLMRRRYWLYYALTFMAGARRQIFIVFAGFLMVEKFGFDAAAIAAIFLVNGVLNMLFAPKIGRLIGKWGERKALTFEYIGLIGVFAAYAFVETAWIAVALYILDHLFFSMAIAIKTYLQKIADPADLAPTAGVAFSINHIAAVGLPALLGLVWVISPAAVFLTGAVLAFGSLLLARLIPESPEPGFEVELPSGERPAT